MGDRKRIFGYFIKGAIVLFIVVAFVIINEVIDQNNKASYRYIGNSNEFAYQVEDISVDNNILTVKGWFFELQSVQNEIKDINKNNKLGIILYDINKNEGNDLDGSTKTRKGHVFSVSREKRTDINDYFKCEYDYSDCGFVGKLDISDIDLENGQFQIVFKPDNDGVDGIQTDAFIDKGTFSFVNPKERITLDVKDTDLEDVIDKGFCIMSYSDYHICVYQYEGKLYWISEDGFAFEGDGSTPIQYQLDTTQFDRLPEKNKSEGAYYINNNFIFEDYEITQSVNCGRYRVAVLDIPKECAITRIVTGYRANGEWIWLKYFRPVYLYK